VASVGGHPEIVGWRETFTTYVPGKAYVWLTNLPEPGGDPSPKSQVKAPEAFAGVVTATRLTTTLPASSTQTGASWATPMTLGQRSWQDKGSSILTPQSVIWSPQPAGSAHHASTSMMLGSQRHPSPAAENSAAQPPFTTGTLWTGDAVAQRTRTQTRLVRQSTAVPATRTVDGIEVLGRVNPTIEVMVMVQATASPRRRKRPPG
jgi:hypothetical protein